MAGTLYVTVVSASNLVAKDAGGGSDPYVEIRYTDASNKSQKIRTKVIKNTLEPTWNQDFELKLAAPKKQPCVEFRVFDEDLVWDDSLGRFPLDTSALAVGATVESTHKLIDVEHGTLTLRLCFVSSASTPASAAAFAASGSAMMQFDVTFLTADEEGAGMNSQKVKVQFIGSGAVAPPPPMEVESKDGFPRGSSKTFRVRTRDPGAVTRVRVERGPESGKADGWKLDRVTVAVITLSGEPGAQMSFPIGKLLNDKQRVAEAGTDSSAAAAQAVVLEGDVTYMIRTKTGDRKGATTTSRVTCVLVGSKLTSPALPLESAAEGVFSRGRDDIFRVITKHVGELQGVKVAVAQTDPPSPWFLEKVTVRCVETPAVSERFFACGDWLGDPSPWERELTASDRDTTDGAAATSKRYRVTVKTGDRRGAGTDANVYINVFGEKGESGNKKLDKPGNCFERNKTDEFGFECQDLGHLQRCVVGHDGKGLSSSWFLDHIVVKEEDSVKSWTFPCGRWLSKNMEDGLTERQLLAASDGSKWSCAALRHYRITTVTGDKRGAGTDANVYINIHGENGDSGVRSLDAPGNTFERNKSDDFGVECVDLGKLVQVTIGHDNKGVGADWFLDKVIIHEEETHLTYYFLCGKWLSKSKEDKLIERVLPASANDAITSLPFHRYRITTITGNRRGAGTDARVYVDITGYKSTSGEKRLDAAGNLFERGKSDTFGIECDYLGELKSLKIWHDNFGINAGWFLDKVIVEEEIAHGKKWWFLCGQWLDKSKGDHEISRELQALAQDGESCSPLRIYIINVHTGNIRGAGTDANVFLEIFGEKGTSEKRKLEGKGNLFERNHMDSFQFECVDLGELQKIIIGHDNSGVNAAWYLEKVVIREQDSGKIWHFPCGRWFARDEEDHFTERELPASMSDVNPTKPLKQYQVTVVTGDRRGGGTDAKVFIEIVGEGGKATTGKKILEGRSGFDRNSTNKFEVESQDLGELHKVIIGHDNSGLNAGWFLDKVIVSEMLKGGKEWYFLCGRWLADDEDDKQIVRELPARNEDGVPCAPMKHYIITVVTGKCRGAGTDAHVYAMLHGTGGSSSRRWLEGKSSCFERGKTDKFSVECVDLGVINRVTIGHDNAGFGAAWFLEKVMVSEEGEESVVTTFNCNQWFSVHEGDHRIERELSTSTPAGAEMLRYVIEVQTGNCRGAGTDADVYIHLFGKLGDSSKYVLPAKRKSFERGSKDVFVFECYDLGPLLYMRIGHNGHGFNSAWFLDKVIVTKEKEEGNALEKCFFICGKWFDKHGGDKQIDRQIMASTEDGVPSLPYLNYQVSVVTGKLSHAGTDANVFIELFGTPPEMSSGVCPLVGKGNLFEKGHTDNFTLELPDIGALSKLRVWHDNTGPGPGWFLDSITITVGDKPAVKFPCGHWLDKKREEGVLTRELFPLRENH
ncbi:hypothetical protein Pelo_458 [Pelomyxa schiedti]|nr:hypothetical protein Pelo_458 [Pelomyxa schiedti]